MLRITGKRALSKRNAFDLLVTVALGSTLATVLLDHGHVGFDDTEAVVLETDGSFSVVGKDESGGRAAIAGVRGARWD